MEQKLDSNLEQLALIQWELEEYKAHTQEQLERLNMQKRDLESELRAKELEVKKLRRLPTEGRSSRIESGEKLRIEGLPSH